MSILKKLIDDNIRNNIKKLAALIGDILLCAFTIVLYVIRAGLDLTTGLIMILFAFKPYLTNYINIIFKGDADAAIAENNILKQEMLYQREIAEWKVQMAAIKGSVPNGVIATTDWNEANEKLKEI